MYVKHVKYLVFFHKYTFVSNKYLLFIHFRSYFRSEYSVYACLQWGEYQKKTLEKKGWKVSRLIWEPVKKAKYTIYLIYITSHLRNSKEFTFICLWDYDRGLLTLTTLSCMELCSLPLLLGLKKQNVLKKVFALK